MNIYHGYHVDTNDVLTVCERKMLMEAVMCIATCGNDYHLQNVIDERNTEAVKSYLASGDSDDDQERLMKAEHELLTAVREAITQYKAAFGKPVGYPKTEEEIQWESESPSAM